MAFVLIFLWIFYFISVTSHVIQFDLSERYHLDTIYNIFGLLKIGQFHSCLTSLKSQFFLGNEQYVSKASQIGRSGLGTRRVRLLDK